MQVKLLKTSNDRRELSKTTSTVATLACKLKENTSILQPVIIVQGDISSYASVNYMYIPAFKRYYFVDNITACIGNILEFSGSVDVLNTYKNEIKNITTFIERQEKIYSPYILDSELPTRVNRFREKKNIGTVGESNDCYYLTVNNGGD
jgi:hypothetical protein